MTRQGKLLMALAIVAGLWVFARTDKGSALVTDFLVSTKRGIRNNNPGNIRLSTTRWLGQVPPERQTDRSFVQFERPEDGIRAIAKILKSYAGRGLITIEKVISTWAPPTENDTRAYIASVAKRTGFEATQPLTIFQMFALIPAIIQHENGEQPYSQELINRGVSLA